MEWEMLPDNVWSLIASKLDVAADRVRFRAVCKSWMSLLPFPPPIWLMIPQIQHHHKKERRAVTISSPCRGFVVAGEQRIYHHLDLPQFHNDKRCVGSTVAIHHHKNKLAIARPGDASWTLLDCDEVEVEHLEDVIFFKGKLYGVCSYGLVMVINIGDNLDSCEIFYFTDEMLEVNPEGCPPKKYYLVEWMGELVLVVRHIVYPPDYNGMKDVNHPAVYNTQGFQLYKLDLPNKDLSENNWVELNSLGDHSLFLGLNTSVSVQISDYNGSLERNCIYFTDDYSYARLMFYQTRSIRRGLDMGVYNLECKTIQPCYRDFVFPSRAAPIWVVPTLPSTERAREQGILTTP